MITSCSIRLSRNHAPEVRLLAWAAVTLDDAWRIHDIRVIRRDFGLQIFCPSRAFEVTCSACSKLRPPRFEFCPHCGLHSGKLQIAMAENAEYPMKQARTFFDLAHPLTREARSELEEIVLSAYEQEKNESEAGSYRFFSGHYEVTRFVENGLEKFVVKKEV